MARAVFRPPRHAGGRLFPLLIVLLRFSLKRAGLCCLLPAVIGRRRLINARRGLDKNAGAKK